MPRRYPIALLSVWPGLAQIWTGQEVLGLILATVFAATLNLAILSRFLWTESFAPGLPLFFASVAVMTWVAALGYTLLWLWRYHPARHREAIDALYREALELYLQGRWDDARSRIETLLILDENDADALMQLASIYVRSGQPDLARKTFRQCLDLEPGAKWKWEVQQAIGRLDSEAHPRSLAA